MRSARAPPRCCSRARSASARQRSGIRAWRPPPRTGCASCAAEPVESETQLAYAALGDLLADVPEAACRISGLQRHALEVALLRAEPEGPESLQRAVGLGSWAFCAPRGGAADLLAIDDVPGSTTLRMRSRSRYGGSRRADRRLLRAARQRRRCAARPRSRGARRTRRSAGAGGLNADELDCCSRSSLGMPPSRGVTVARVRRASGGNLYFALEIGRALAERGERLDPSDELPIPASLQELVRDRLAQPAGRGAGGGAGRRGPRAPDRVGRRRCSRRERRRLGGGDRGRCPRARRRAPHLRAPAARDGRLPAAVQGERRELHARLAEILDDPEERARHWPWRRMNRTRRSPRRSRRRRRAAGRGAPDAAAELLEQARG